MAQDDDRLVAWKRIARYLNKGERTVRRWSAESGLPVHRMPGGARGSVFAYKSEIDAWLAEHESAPTSRASERHVLAVLPMAVLGSDSDLDALAQGVTAETISALGSLGGIAVIGRTSVLAFTARGSGVADIRAELGADAVLEASIALEDQHCRINAQLVGTKDQTQLWARSYSFVLTRRLALQMQVAATMATDVGEALTGSRMRVRQVPAYADSVAADDYCKAGFTWRE